MSIERMDSVLLVVPSSDRDRFIDWLYEERQVHIREFIDTPEEWSARFSKIEKERNPAYIEAQVMKLQSSIDILSGFHRRSSDFLESLFPVRRISTLKEIEETVQLVDPEGLQARCQELYQTLTTEQEQLARLQIERDQLEEFSFLSLNVSVLESLKNYSLRIVSATGSARQLLTLDQRVLESTYIEEADSRESATVFFLITPVGNEAVVDEIIADFGLRELALPPIRGTVAEAIAEMDSHISEITARIEMLRKKGIAESKEWLSKAELALAAWESTHLSIAQEQYMVSSGNMFAARGYIKSINREYFTDRLEKTFPDAEVLSYAAPLHNEPPVSMKWNNFFRPAGLLVKMFGLPSYKSIDPTAFLTLSFLIFFGICFGDILYGAMLIGVSLLLRKRFHDQKGLIEFFRLFTYAGVSTIVFGILTGSWGADLPAYFGAGNPIDRLRLKLTLLDPLAKPIVALMIAVGIGVVNQLYGILVRAYRDIHRGDIHSAIYDGLFWFVYLVSLLTASLGAVMGAPGPLVTTSLVIFGLAAIGLVMTQGRHEASPIGRFITGLVSLYGIMGTYGTTAFLGDCISYARLMALGLTTTVVGMSFNIIANMVRELPIIGFLLFLTIIVFGHVFNFTMSILSAFVHSARLILLEWFSRFYEGGGVAFQPYGFSHAKVDIVE